MEKRNRVFIATSLDGYIADKDGGLDWLHAIPNPDNLDMGYTKFMGEIDAIVMGRVTFETVCSFGIDWPYQKPVFVLSNSLTEIPEKYRDKVHLVKGTLAEVLNTIHEQGYGTLYIDGGKTIQSFLKEDLIDDMIITTIPVLLGGGFSLFGELSSPLKFRCVGSEVFLDAIVQNHFVK
ncbi:dihydrofolate reductase family protein [Algivirga pacifica]|uniref:Dihydrofolate reductase family protein n=1 Tax=Algivirga pacifica TaxID=1162670 RepID=A0ABP9DEX7_9BACT